MCNKVSLWVFVCICGVASTVSADLVGWWRFDEGAGSTVYDRSGRGNDGIVIGGAEWVQGQLGGGLELDGTSGHVEIPDFSLTTDEITFVAWINGWKAVDWAGIVGSRVGGGAEMIFGNNDTLHYVWNGPEWNWHDAPAIPQNEWAMVAMAIESTQATAYVYVPAEGLQQAVSETAHTERTVGTLQIGWVNCCGGTRYFRGIVDEVQVYDRALNEEEILAVLTPEPVPQAYGPTPQDGSMVQATSAVLGWMPGDLAVSHDVYFGESFEDVDQAASGGALFLGNQTETTLAVSDLTPGATYYWRVDEVDDSHPDSPWKGPIWSFQVQPLEAWAPTPADTSPYVRPDEALTWEPGMGALFHTVYFGESFDEVNAATTGGFMIADASYDPGPLEPGKTYYWRVDEFAGTGTRKGLVWSFTTVPEIAVTNPNLSGWWTLDEGAGMTAVDWSGHGNHGTLIGDPQWTDAYYGLALEFDGTNYVDTGNTTDLATWTIAAWVKSPAAPAATAGTGPVNRDQNYQIVWDHPDETFRGAAAMAAEGAWHAASFGTLAGNTWYHLAATFDGTALTAYKNGALITTNSEAVGIPNAEPASLKLARHAVGANFFKGVVDDVRLYDRALSEDEVQQAMRGNPLVAGSPDPGPGTVVDVRDATTLSWQTGDTAVSHDVYFGTDRNAVAGAGNDAPEFQGNQPGTSFSLTGLVEFGGGDYFWRIDEVDAAGTVQTGYIWQFTIPDYIVVDDFESYTNDVGSRVFEKWVDGVGFTQPEPGHPGNSTNALVGHDIWTAGTPYTTIVETGNVYGGGQAMPIYYDNTIAPAVSDADRTFTPGQNWTVEGVTTLVVHFRGQADNTGDLYVKINGVKVPHDGDPADIAGSQWIAWEIDLASVGVSLTNVTTLTIGIEGGQTGVLYVDDIILTRPASP